MKKIALLLVFNLLLSSTAWAQTAPVQKVLTEPGAKILITQVNFKNKEQDWIKIYYEAPSLAPVNIKGLQLKNDKVFKTIDQDFAINSGSTITLTFKSDSGDNPNSLELFSSKSGLTATTEQIIVVDTDGTVLDAMCWSNKKPTTKEQADMQSLFETGGWISNDPTSCLDSGTVKSDQTIQRLTTTDTNSVADWEVLNETPPPPVNPPTIPTPQPVIEPKVATPVPVPTSIQSEPPPIIPKIQAPVVPQIIPVPQPTKATNTIKKTNTKSAPKPTTAKKTTKAPAKTKTTSKKKKPTYHNGDLSKDILINEIFAHAKTDDRHNEWIELYNRSEEDINLGNWIIDDDEKGSKAYVLPDTVIIPTNGFLLIKAEDSKLNLNNNKDIVRLFDYNKALLQTVTYEEAPIDKSYSRITIANDDGTEQEQWLWEPIPTPAEPNATYQEFIGTIKNAPTFSENYSFIFTTQDGQDKNIFFNEALIAGPLAQATFTPQTQATLLVAADTTITDPSSPKHYLLKKYEITNPENSSQNTDNSGWNFLFISAAALGVTFLILAKKWPLIQKMLAK